MDNNNRLDVYVVEQVPSLSRSSAAKLIEQGGVIVNGKACTKSGYKIRPADEIKINYSPTDAVAPAGLKLKIIYEDKDCVVVDKPAGILSHSKGAYNPEATVATWLEKYWEGAAGERAGIVHRLDRATSGVMICAKNAASHTWLQKQFGQRKVKKTYIAIIKGELKQPEAIIDMPIIRNPKRPQTFRVGSNGKAASTAYKVLQSNNGYSLLELKPTTGRTHQLRVHLNQLGHPILGDKLYGGADADRMYLHAYQLELTLPSRVRKVFESKLPKQFNELLV